MKKNKESITVVVGGIETEVDANINAPLLTIIPKALEQTGNTGQSPENWELRDEHGNLLDLHKKIGDYGFTDETKLYLSLSAGVTGGYRITR